MSSGMLVCTSGFAGTRGQCRIRLAAATAEETREDAARSAAAILLLHQLGVSLGLGGLPCGCEARDLNEHLFLGARVDLEIALELAVGQFVQGVHLDTKAFVFLSQVFLLVLDLLHGLGLDLELVAEMTPKAGQFPSQT